MSEPENIPEHCPGVGTEQSGKADACDGCPNQVRMINSINHIVKITKLF